MKIKYTQGSRDADVDGDLAVAMALEEEGGAEICNSDDDFQGTGSSSAFFHQTLALRSCAMKKLATTKKTPRKNLRLEKKRKSGGEIGDVLHLDDGAGRGKEMKVHCDAESIAASTGSEGLASKDRERLCKEPNEAGKRALKDHNSKSTEHAKIESVITKAVVLAEGDENGNYVIPETLEKISSLRTPDLEDDNEYESTDCRIDSSLVCDLNEQQGLSKNNSKFDSKRKTESSIHDTGWSLHSDGAKKVKSIAGVQEDVGIQRSEVTEGSAAVDLLRFNSDGSIENDLEAEFDDDMIICTQVEAPLGLELGQSAGEPSGVAVDLGKKTGEDRPKRRHNIYDILLGNNRTNRVPMNVSKSTVDKGVECHENVEEMETPGSAMRALVHEAELDYEALDFSEEEDESMDPLDFPVCEVDLVDPSVSGREQHVSDCLENDYVSYDRTNPGDCLGREADNTGATENLQRLSQQTVTIETLFCPVCGISVEELSTAQREEHTNACLEKDDVPCVRTDFGGHLSRLSETAETTGNLQLLSSPTNVMAESLVCPVCGDCIEELSTAQREEHTNACLDKTNGEDLGAVTELAGAEVEHALGRPDVGPVVTWLTNLNLGKYADIFVKEEIDLDTLKWLNEEDLSFLGITALGPRRKIVCAIQELVKSVPAGEQIAARQEGQKLSDSVVISSHVNTLQGPKKSIADFFVPQGSGPRVPAPDRSTLAGLSSKSSIADFFIPQGSGPRVQGLDRSTLAAPKAPGTTSIAGASARNWGQRGPIPTGGNMRNARTSGIPKWMCIPGTSFRVDAFKYQTGNCSTWFLTHFHSDHYGGLTRSFRHGKIFCSLITSRLVKLRIGVPSDRIQALPLNETVLIDGVRVTFIDANHCPGSVMILFQPPNGKAVLHTGDFRFCSEMTSNEILKTCRITTLILDTTYCDPQYDFPKQDLVVQFVIDAIQAEAFNPKTLFLIGTYNIGKERIFLEVGKVLQQYIYVGAAKQKLLDCMDLAQEYKRWLTRKDQESHIHVVPLWSVASFKRMGSISRHYHGRYNSIVAFSPTGWTFGKDKKRMQGRPGRRLQQGSIIRYEVPYSEHSSFTELREFVRAISPENIIPHVFGRKGLSVDAMVASLLSEDS